jgi:Family of unknown function (DUF6516)
MKAELIVRQRIRKTEYSFVELVAWNVPSPMEGSNHNFKYRFAYVVNEVCVLRYDNERGKGDHKHLYGVEYPYKFSNLKALIADFNKDLEGIKL